MLGPGLHALLIHVTHSYCKATMSWVLGESREQDQVCPHGAYVLVQEKERKPVNQHINAGDISLGFRPPVTVSSFLQVSSLEFRGFSSAQGSLCE